MSETKNKHFKQRATDISRQRTSFSSLPDETSGKFTGHLQLTLRLSFSSNSCHVHTAKMLLPPQTQRGASLSRTHVALPLSLSLCNPFTPFHSYLKTWTDSKHWHTWHGVITTLRSALGLVWLQREEEKVTVMLSCVHSEMPFHSHTYIFMSVYPPGPIVEKEAVSITGRPLWPPWNSCVCLPYLRVCNGSINNGYSLVWS